MKTYVLYYDKLYGIYEYEPVALLLVDVSSQKHDFFFYLIELSDSQYIH
jgi:hypothetical protein